MLRRTAFALVAALVVAQAANSHDIIRHAAPNFPIAQRETRYRATPPSPLPTRTTSAFCTVPPPGGYPARVLAGGPVRFADRPTLRTAT